MNCQISHLYLVHPWHYKSWLTCPQVLEGHPQHPRSSSPFTTRAMAELSIIVHLPFAPIKAGSPLGNFKMSSAHLKTPWSSLTPTCPHSKFTGIKGIHSLLGTLAQVSKTTIYSKWHDHAIPSLNFLPIMENYTPGILSPNYSRKKNIKWPTGTAVLGIVTSEWKETITPTTSLGKAEIFKYHLAPDQNKSTIS